MTKNIYNPMSKEFQDECKRLGLTGRQLTAKYQKEGKYIEKDDIYFKREDRRSIPRDRNIYTEKELLDILAQSYKDLGRPPTINDLGNNSGYPSYGAYRRVFGTWSNALKLAELDVDSMIKKGVIETKIQKGRFGEIIIRDHFKIYPVDLAGENCNSPWDGICPNGKTYDVKSSGLDWTGRFYHFGAKNEYKDLIDIYYLLGFNEDYTKLNYGWRIPGEIAKKDHFYIGSTCRSEFNIENMKEYDITDKLREILNKYDFFNKS